MKSFAIGLFFIAGVAESISVHNPDKILFRARQSSAVAGPAPAAACHTTMGARNPALAGITLEELKAELAKRELPCVPAPAPSPSGPTPAPSPAPPMAACSSADGTGASSVYPCQCLGAAPSPAPGPIEPEVCDDDSRHCLAGKCVHPACTHSDGEKASDHYPCTCLAGGPSPAPAPGPAGPQTCKDKSHNCKSGLCVAPPDNFADELVDQANVNFEKLDANKDGCISDGEMTKTLEEQLVMAKAGHAGARGYYWQEKEVKEGLEHLSGEVAKKTDSADKNGDGCVDEDEFKKVQKAFNDCPKQFMMMDTNGDGKISRQEAANFVVHHMDHADISYGKQRAIFEAADSNKDNFLNEQEFCTAGKKYEGDGNSKF